MEKALHMVSDRSRPGTLLEPMRQSLRELCLLGAALTENVNILLPHLGSLTTLRLDHFGFHELDVDVVFRSCPQLESLYLKKMRLMAIDRDSTPLSSLDLTLGAHSPLVPSRRDKFLRLKVLKVIISQVDLSRLVDILAVCPKLVELAFVCNFLSNARCKPESARTISLEEFTSFLGQACRQLRTVHFSVVEKRLESDTAQALLRGKPTVTEWSFMPKDLEPLLGAQLRQVQRVITSLEIGDFRQHRCPVHEGFDLMQTALHQFLCSAPLLRRLKINKVNCATDRLDPFSLHLQAEPRRRSSVEEDIAESTKIPRVWACRNLHSLTLRFTQSHSVEGPRKFVARDVRVLFGYLSRVSPELRHMDIGLDIHPLDLQSGLCLITRLKHLDTLTVEMQSTFRRWSRGPDLTWIDPHVTALSRFRQLREMQKWQPLVQQEQELIQRRVEFLERWQGPSQTTQRDKSEDGETGFARSLLF